MCAVARPNYESSSAVSGNVAYVIFYVDDSVALQVLMSIRPELRLAPSDLPARVCAGANPESGLDTDDDDSAEGSG